MEIVFTGKNVEVTESIREFTKEKLEKVLKYLRHVTEVHVFLSVEKHRHRAEVVIHAKSNTLSGADETGDMYSSIGLAMDKIEKQGRRRKDKLIGRKRRGANKETPASQAASVPGREASAEENPRSITKTDYEIKPMSVEEAALQMEITSEHFIVFRNSSTETINVLFRKKDGDLGLIDPGVM